MAEIPPQSKYRAAALASAGSEAGGGRSDNSAAVWLHLNVSACIGMPLFWFGAISIVSLLGFILVIGFELKELPDKVSVVWDGSLKKKKKSVRKGLTNMSCLMQIMIFVRVKF